MVAFYERGVSRKNFSRAGGLKVSFDRQPPLPASMPTLPCRACLAPRHRLSLIVPPAALLAAVDGRERPGSEQLRQPARVHLVRLVAVSEQAVLPPVPDDDLRLGVLKDIIEPGGLSASSKVTSTRPRRPLRKSGAVAAPVSTTDSITSLPAALRTAMQMLAL